MAALAMSYSSPQSPLIPIKMELFWFEIAAMKARADMPKIPSLPKALKNIRPRTIAVSHLDKSKLNPCVGLFLIWLR